jgi:tRNA A-37 threonylcarbamoyl transferase component Bud32
LEILPKTRFGDRDKVGISVVETRKPSKKQDVVLFSTTSEEPNSIFAYRMIKTPNKMKEYVVINSLGQVDIGAPEIFYLNANTREVITNWVPGEQLAYFNGSKELPVPSEDELHTILDSTIKLHINTSAMFNAVEEEPAIERLVTDFEELTDSEDYFAVLLRNYQRVEQHTNKRRKNLSEDEFSLAKELIKRGQRKLKSERELIQSVPSFSLVHGDLHPENIIRTEKGQIRLVDFEHLHYGDRAWELAFFFEQGSQAGFVDMENRQRLINYYKTGLLKADPSITDPTLEDRVNVYDVYVVLKFLGLICGGLASNTENEINRELFEGVLSRAQNLQL